MRNIILFLLHFSIISHLKNIYSINTQISHGRFKNSKCFISNYNLYNSTSTNDLLSNKKYKKQIKGQESEIEVKETGNDSGILLESPRSALKSIVDKGSIKSSSVRHEILDKESLLDELIVSKDNYKGVVDDLDKSVSDSGQNVNYGTKKLEEVLNVLDSSVLKKTVDKKEQVIKPSDKILKRRSKETIYTRLQNYVKSSEPFLIKHGLLDEVKYFVHLLHWNVWHTGSLERLIACSWTNNQFERFEKLIDRIDNILNKELKSFLVSTTNTDEDLIGGIIDERTNFLFSNNYVYNKLREIIELGEFEIYKDRIVNLYLIKYKIMNLLRKIKSYFIFDIREIKLYRRIKYNISLIKNRWRNFKFKIYSKLNKTKIFMNKFPTPITESINKRYKTFNNNINNKRDEVYDYDKINIVHLLKYLSHSYIKTQSLKELEDIGREDLYKKSPSGKWCLYFVGSGSRQPTNTRLTSTMAFKKIIKGGSIWLFDCGEGTKNGLENLGLDPSQVERIFLTHLHGDHCYGIFSFLYLRERTKNLEIYGPPGTRKLINAIHQNTSTANYNKFTIHELHPKNKKDNMSNSNNIDRQGTQSNFSSNSSSIGVNQEENVDIYINNEGYYNVFKDDSIEILAADLEHTMPTVGYVIQQKEGKEDQKIEIMNNINNNNNDNNTNYNNNYNNMNDYDFENIFDKYNRNTGYKGQNVKKIVICQDSSDSSKMKKIGMNADILIHEATLSSTSSLVSGILLDIIRDNKNIILYNGSIRSLYNFLTNIETKLGCFNFTLSALSSFVKCERYYLLQKLNIFKNFISNFKPIEKEFVDNQNIFEIKTKKEMEKKLKEKWLNYVFSFMDRLNALNELNKNEYFTKRLQNRYKLMEKLSKVVPSLDLNKVLDTASKKLIFSKIAQNIGWINYAYEKYDIIDKYKEKFIVDLPKYLNSVSGDIFEYWNEILQLELSSQSNPNFENSIDQNWKLLYDRIIGSFGHSTPNMAGKFANEIKAKKLILTHFSNKYPGDEKFENLLTMIRIENEARMGYSKNGSTTSIPVIAAWDKMKVKL